MDRVLVKPWQCAICIAIGSATAVVTPVPAFYLMLLAITAAPRSLVAPFVSLGTPVALVMVALLLGVYLGVAVGLLVRRAFVMLGRRRAS